MRKYYHLVLILLVCASCHTGYTRREIVREKSLQATRMASTWLHYASLYLVTGDTTAAHRCLTVARTHIHQADSLARVLKTLEP